MGSTPGGRDWCIKALHPSDPITEVRGVPDESAVPSMMMNYQSVYTVTPDPSATGTWSLDGQMIPNPLSFGACTYTDSVSTKYSEFINSQIAGATHAARLSAFLAQFQRWRLAYAAVTIYQDGPDLANQGTVVVCQKPVDPTRFNIMPAATVAAGTTALGLHHVFHMEADDLPDYTSSQAMPNAYFGRSREGAYIPLKLTRTHQVWHSHRDLTYQANAASLNAYSSSTTGGQLQIPASVTAVQNDIYPFLSLNDLHELVDGSGYASTVGELTSDFCNENWADFSFRNMAVTTSLSLFFRFGFEVQVLPTSILAPHLKLSPPADEVAIGTYFAVSRELKDAYPADFNDLGKIWDVISSVARTIAPVLSAVPVVGPILPAAVNSVAAVGDRIRQARKNMKPTRGSVASAADVAVLRDAFKKMAAVTVAGKNKGLPPGGRKA